MFGMSTYKKLKRIDKKFEELFYYIQEESLTKDLLERYFLSIKTQLKDTNPQIFQIKSIKLHKKLNKKLNCLISIKNKIDMALKEKKILNEILSEFKYKDINCLE